MMNDRSDSIDMAFRPFETWSPSHRMELGLWWIPIDGEFSTDREILSPQELERLESIRMAKVRSQFVVTRSALRRILSLYLDRGPKEFAFEEWPHGKPRILQGDGLEFNLSHSGSWTLLGITRGLNLGVDIEICRRERDIDALAERYFAPEEATGLRDLNSAEALVSFYRLWTLKEAYLKALGTGLTFSSSRFAFSIAEESSPRLLWTEAKGPQNLWRFQELEAPSGYKAALCIEDAQSVRSIPLEPIHYLYRRSRHEPNDKR